MQSWTNQETHGTTIVDSIIVVTMTMKTLIFMKQLIKHLLCSAALMYLYGLHKELHLFF